MLGLHTIISNSDSIKDGMYAIIVLLMLLIENSDNNKISRCPATMLADSRIDSVIGRIKLLTISMITIKFIRKFGVPMGVSVLS